MLDDPEPTPRNRTGHLIRRAQQKHVSVWQRVVTPDVTSVQFATLAVVGRGEGTSQRELGDELDLDRSTIADIVARIERIGLIQRHRDPLDSRRNVLQLTDEGHRVLAQLEPKVDEVESALTGRLSPDERTELRRLLRIVLID